MGAFFVYILKSSFCLALFYLFYRLFLSRETFHRFNRMALLSLMVLSCVVPLIQITVNDTANVSTPFFTIEELMLTSGAGIAVEADHQGFMWRESLLLIYFVGIVFFLFRNVWSLMQLCRLIRSCNVYKESDGVYIITHCRKMAPFSWMKFIVISEADLAECGREILTHERAHISACHSIDLLIADICVFFQWFNPAAWLLKRELQNIHEYEADAAVLAQGIDARNYQLLLIRKAVGTRLYSMANSFNHSSLKKRITMMMRKKSNPWARAKYLYVLPLAAVAVAAFARPEVSDELNEISAAKVNDLSAIVKTEMVKSAKNVTTAPQKDDTKVFDVVEKMPQFPGGDGELFKFLSKNVKYPKAAGAKKEQGRVILKFIVDTDGSITDCEVVKSVSPELDAEALRIMSIMPKWIPGQQRGQNVRVQYHLPVIFRLNTPKTTDKIEIIAVASYKKDKNALDEVTVVGYNKDDQHETSKTTTVVIDKTTGTVKKENKASAVVFNKDAKNITIIIDGKKSSGEALSKLDPNKIESISVLKDKSATEPYGEEAKDGVIIVTTKKK